MRGMSIPETPETKALVVALCGYEIAAILTGRLPTLTAINSRHPALGVVLVGALAVHFWIPTPTSPPRSGGRTNARSTSAPTTADLA